MRSLIGIALGPRRAVLRWTLCGTLPFTLTGCKATPPSHAEIKVAYWTKHHITVRGKRDRNPIPATSASVAEGKELFVSYCMVCHGLDGQNTGVPFATTMAPGVPSLASEDVQAYSDGQLHWIIRYGLYPSGMPPSRDEFSDDDMWAMVNYIRHLPPIGSLGEPNVYGGSGGGGAR
jgi:mono/diheme cytochrome c family protein